MCLSANAEEHFVAQLVERMRKLLATQDMGLEEKLDAISLTGCENAGFLADLKLQRQICDEMGKRRSIDRLISLCHQADIYLKSTSEFLSHKQIYRHSLRQPPRLFAVPAWDRERAFDVVKVLESERGTL